MEVQQSPRPLIDTEALVASAQSLEALPISVGRLASLVADDNADIRELVEVISYDQALTGGLLRQANSAAMAGREPIKTVHEAVIRLGTGTLLALAFSASVSKKMNRPIPQYGLAEGELWRHSVAAALAAETVRSHSKVAVPAEVATAALLHDFGKLVLCDHFGPQVLTLLQAAAETDGLNELEAEAAVFGLDHAELGGLIARHWRLPDTIIEGVASHHDPSEGFDSVATTVYLANVIAEDILNEDRQAVADKPQTEIDATNGKLRELGFKPDDYRSLVSASHKRFVELSGRYL